MLSDKNGNSNENVKKKKRLDLQDRNFARASHFLVDFSAVAARLHVSWRTSTSHDEIFFLFLNLGMVCRKSIPGEFAYI